MHALRNLARVKYNSANVLLLSCVSIIAMKLRGEGSGLSVIMTLLSGKLFVKAPLPTVQQFMTSSFDPK